MTLKKTWYRRESLLKGNRVSILWLICVLLFLIFGTANTNEGVEAEKVIQIEKAIRQGVTQCYALEGIYPPNLDYLKDYYGIQVDEARYIIHYEIFASNIYPSIIVLEKNWGDDYE